MNIDPIAYIQTPFTDKFGIPKQPNLAPSVEGIIVIEKAFSKEEAFKDLDKFSHLTLIFGFHKTKSWDFLVRPPRLGGNKKVGVFTTRSPFRPNNLGISHVEILKVDLGNPIKIHVKGIDLLDQTPIYDIKPYIPRWDSFPNATMGWIEEDEPLLAVNFETEALEFFKKFPHRSHLKQMITEILSQDPRPAYKKGDFNQEHFSQLEDIEINWKVTPSGVQVTKITK
tara:strand:+ start:67938 stop:68615 length:678 start_codon:yes stop_codon:yes gene_type:complete